MRARILSIVVVGAVSVAVCWTFQYRAAAYVRMQPRMGICINLPPVEVAGHEWMNFDSPWHGAHEGTFYILGEGSAVLVGADGRRHHFQRTDGFGCPIQ